MSVNNESLNIYKLIILYTLKKVHIPLPSGIISDYITKKGYTNFFNVQNAFGELLQAEMIREDTTYHLAYYSLTDAGHAAFEYFGSGLSAEIKKEIDTYLLENKYDIAENISHVSDYHKTTYGTYEAVCTLRDGNHTLYSLSLDVPTEQDAIRVCENWRECSTALYQDSLRQLLSRKNS